MRILIVVVLLTTLAGCMFVQRRTTGSVPGPRHAVPPPDIYGR